MAGKGRPKDSSSIPTTDAAEDVTNEFSDLVIAVSGKIPGQTHEDLERMIEEAGASFEKLNVRNCTHLVTTGGNFKSRTKTQKIKDATETQACEIVSIKWLLDSVKNKKPVDVKGYRLENGGTCKSAVQTKAKPKAICQKRKRETELEDEASPATKPKNNVWSRRSFLSSIVADKSYENRENIVIWMDEENVVWDATLLKHCLVTGEGGLEYHRVLTCRIQILYDSKSKQYMMWSSMQSESNAKTALTEWGSLKTASSRFEEEFKEASGLAWKDRQKAPPANKFVFATYHREDGDMNIHAEDGTPLPVEVSKAWNVVTGAHNTSYIILTIRSLSVHLTGHALDKQSLQLGVALLTRLSELLSISPTSSVLSHAEKLGKCYRGVLGLPTRHPKPPGHRGTATAFPNCPKTKSEWVAIELERLIFLRNLHAVNDTACRSAQKSEIQIAQRFHRLLGLKVDLVDSKSAEFTTLQEYFDGSFGAGHNTADIVNIFRIERPGEAARFSQWQEDNKSLVGTRRLLWHGSHCVSFIGILAQGFRTNISLPHVGSMNSGIFFADFAGKSVAYCRSQRGMALMLLCEVELGSKSHQSPHASYFTRDPMRRNRCASILAPGRTCFKKWKDAKCVHEDLAGVLMPDVQRGRVEDSQPGWLHHNEYVVYDPAQILQRYLFHIKLR